MRLLQEQRRNTCLLSLNFCDFSQFASMKTFRFGYALIITKNLVPPPFFMSGCAGDATLHFFKLEWAAQSLLHRLLKYF